jgi:hypothetical protein
MQRLKTCLPLVLLAIAACGGDSGGDSNPLPACPSGNCGQEQYRRAVPRKDGVRIPSPRNANARAKPLDAQSDALLVIDGHVMEIDEVVDAVFSDIEGAAGTTPEIESDTEHQWRNADPDLAGQEDVLRITSADGNQFDIEFLIGDVGFDAATATPVVSGTMVVDDDDGTFELTLHLDALADVSGEDMAGEIVIAEMPFEAGDREVWYDFHAVDFGDGDVQDSRTTYWEFDESSHALEFVADWQDEVATVYARWDDEGGRYDHHTAFVDEELGQVDAIATNCWSDGGAEVFDAWAIIDEDEFYGELDGSEDACEFGPVEDHPDPGTDFDDLPADGEWDLLDLLPFEKKKE